MQAKARVKYLKSSPRKMRQVAQLIKGRPVEEALNILNYTPKVAAHHLAKTLKAAAANAISGVGTAKLKAEDLSIANIMVDQAPTAKRVRFQSMGRVFRLRKRFCHLTVIVEGEPEAEVAKPKRARKPKKEASAEKKSSGGAKAKVKAKKPKSKAAPKAAKASAEKKDSKKPAKVTATKARAKKATGDKKKKTDKNITEKVTKSGSKKKSEEA